MVTTSRTRRVITPSATRDSPQAQTATPRRPFAADPTPPIGNAALPRKATVEQQVPLGQRQPFLVAGAAGLLLLAAAALSWTTLSGAKGPESMLPAQEALGRCVGRWLGGAGEVRILLPFADAEVIAQQTDGFLAGLAAAAPTMVITRVAARGGEEHLAQWRRAQAGGTAAAVISLIGLPEGAVLPPVGTSLVVVGNVYHSPCVGDPTGQTRWLRCMSRPAPVEGAGGDELVACVGRWFTIEGNPGL